MRRLLLLVAGTVTSAAAAQSPPPIVPLGPIEVVGTTPLPGIGTPLEQVP